MNRIEQLQKRMDEINVILKKCTKCSYIDQHTCRQHKSLKQEYAGHYREIIGIQSERERIKNYLNDELMRLQHEQSLTLRKEFWTIRIDAVINVLKLIDGGSE